MNDFGALPTAAGVRFGVWAPQARSLVLLTKGFDPPVERPLERREDGVWAGVFPDVRVGDLYAFSIDGSPPRPDPASRFQPEGVHGWSEIIDPAAFRWTDDAWSGVEPGRVVLYELHVGTFSGHGTFRDVASRLEYLRDLGVTAIELMPLADFPGRRNWGYDGASLFAPSHSYGRPDDLRALVDRAHAVGLAVVLDVVYNHLGPEGAYLSCFSPSFFTATHATPWGPAVNLDAEGSPIVRKFLTENATHWVREYHVDGLRLDATHALIDTSDTPFVAELTARVHAASTRHVLVYAEDARNSSDVVRPPASGGWGLDGVWADDFHHVLRRMIAGDTRGYYVDYEGTIEELAATLSNGWLYSGQYSKHLSQPRGTDPSEVPLRKCVICVQNHDQIGNRARGDRLHHAVDPAAWRAAVTLLLTAPMTPLLFMGQEWAASAPFLFFTDYEPALGALVCEGRRREFRDFPEFATDQGVESIPDPQADGTFEASRLDWLERHAPPHACSLALHRALLHERAERPALQGSPDTCCTTTALDDATILVRRRHQDADASDMLIVARIRGGGTVRLDAGPARVVLTTEDASFASDPEPIVVDSAAGTISFRRPGAVLIEIPAPS